MKQPESDLARGLERLQRGELEQAFHYLCAAHEAAPHDRAVHEALTELGQKAAERAANSMHNPAASIRLNQLAKQAYLARGEMISDEHDRQTLRVVAFYLGAAMQQLRRDDKAIRHYQEAVALMPDHPDATMNLALLLRKANRFAETVQLLSPFVARFPENGPLTAQLIAVLQELGRMDEAVALAREAAIRFPDLQVMYCGYYYRYEKGGAVLTA